MIQRLAETAYGGDTTKEKSSTQEEVDPSAHVEISVLIGCGAASSQRRRTVFRDDSDDPHSHWRGRRLLGSRADDLPCGGSGIDSCLPGRLAQRGNKRQTTRPSSSRVGVRVSQPRLGDVSPHPYAQRRDGNRRIPRAPGGLGNSNRRRALMAQRESFNRRETTLRRSPRIPRSGGVRISQEYASVGEGVVPLQCRIRSSDSR